jgi:hypothetical protein
VLRGGESAKVGGLTGEIGRRGQDRWRTRRRAIHDADTASRERTRKWQLGAMLALRANGRCLGARGLWSDRIIDPLPTLILIPLEEDRWSVRGRT